MFEKTKNQSIGCDNGHEPFQMIYSHDSLLDNGSTYICRKNCQRIGWKRENINRVGKKTDSYQAVVKDHITYNVIYDHLGS